MPPIEHGAAVVIESLTKWIGGHGTSIGGVIVDGGNFDWGNGASRSSPSPTPSYHGLKFWDVFGDFPGLGNVAFGIRARVKLQRDFGASLSPFNAQQFLLGVETLSLRVQRHSDNALAVAELPRGAPEGRLGRLPGSRDHPTKANAKKFLSNGYGGVVVFGVKGGLEAGKKLIESVELFSHLANVGDAKSLIIHPASTTHSQLSEDELVARASAPDFVRLVGRHRGHRRHHRRPRAGARRRCSRDPQSRHVRRRWRRAAASRGPTRSCSLARAGLELASGRRSSDVDRGRATRRTASSTRTVPTRCSICHALSGDAHVAAQAVPTAGGADASPAGGTDGRSGQGDRHRPLLRHLRQRARRLHGHDRAGRRSIPRPASPTGSHFPLVTIEDMVDVQARLLDISASSGCRGRRRLDGRHAGARVGASAIPSASRRASPTRPRRASRAQAIAFNEVGRTAILGDPAFAAATTTARRAARARAWRSRA